MKLRQLASGIFSGYVSKAFQLVVSIIIVPFLLDPEALGIQDYGRAFAILGTTGMIALATLGLHFSAERAISRAMGDRSSSSTLVVGELVGSATKVLTALSVSLIAPILIFDSFVLQSIGIPAESKYRWALIASAIISILENSFSLLRVPLVARGDITYVNLVGIFELIGRTAVVIILFTTWGGNLTHLLAIQSSFIAVRHIFFLARLEPHERSALIRAPMLKAENAMQYSAPVTIAEGSVLLIRSAPVILASRFLGATEAGLVALVANTLQGYILQIFVAVFQPISGPIASRLRIAESTPARRHQLIEIDALYSLVVAVLFCQMIAWTPVLIPVWLGAGYDGIVLPSQIMMVGCAAQTIALVRRSILIGEGVLPEAVPIILGSTAVACLLMFGAMAVFQSWISAIAFSTLQIAVSNGLGIDRIFSRLVGVSRQSRVPRIVGLVAMFLAAWWSGRQMHETNVFQNLAVAIIPLGASLAIGFASILSYSRGKRVAFALYRARDSSIFE